MSRLAFLHPALIAMGLHVASARVLRAVRGYRHYAGSAPNILRAGLEDCWSGEYLTASPGHYRQFWTRDTGFAAGSLVRLGGPWPGRLLSTLAWAIGIWRARKAHVTTTISPLLRWPVDIFDYGVDSLPLLLDSLRTLASSSDPLVREGAAALANEHRDWIAAEVEHFIERVVDPATGLVRTDRAFSAHRDTFKNGSTAYANTMVALLARTVAETGWGPELLSHHFREDWGALLRRHFWIGDRFRDRLGTDETSGEANVWPFRTGLIDDRDMLEAALGVLRREGYATPVPLRFETSHRRDGLLLAYRLWSPDYQTTTIWTSLGSIYLSLLNELDPDAARPEIQRMSRLIERDGTFWEVLDGRTPVALRDGALPRPWRSRSGLSVSDQSMLWSAILFELVD